MGILHYLLLELSVISEWIRPIIAVHLWQATIFSAAAFLVLIPLRRAPARVRYVVLLIATVRFVLPPIFFTFIANQSGLGSLVRFFAPVQMPELLPTEITVAQQQIYANTQMANDHNQLYCALTIVWLVGALALVGRWLWRKRQFRQAVYAGAEVMSGRELDALNRVRTWLLIKRHITLITSPLIMEPGVWRMWRPVVILPEGIVNHLTDAELEAVLMHELIHIMRWDNLVSNLSMLLCCIFWFHPIVWLLDRRLLAERERSCDEQVIELGGANTVYASSIVKVLRHGLGWSVAGVSSASGSDLGRRLELIMNSNTNKKIAVWHRMLIGGFSTAIIVVSIAAGVFNSQNVAARSNTSVRKINSDQSAIERAIVPGTITTGKNKPGNNTPKAGESSVEKAPQTESRNTLAVPQDEYTPIQFVNSNGSPIAIKEAKVKISDLGETGTNELNGSVIKHTFGVRVQVKISNPTDQKLTGAIIQLNSRESGRRIFIIGNPKLNVLPQTEFSITSMWMVYSPTGSSPIPEDLIAKVVGVSFENGEDWGEPLPVPPSVEQSTPSSAPAPDITPLTVVRSEGVLRMLAIEIVQPVYPALARMARQSGDVVVRITIDENGLVKSAEAISGPPLLQAAAVEAAHQSTFKPTFLAGKAVVVVSTLTFNFHLDEF